MRGITAPAGAITISTRLPNYEAVDGYVQQSFSDRDLSNTQFGVSLPIIDDTLALRIAGLYDRNELNGVENAVTGTHESGDTRSGRITLGWRPADTFEMNLVYQHMETFADSFLNQLVGTGASGTFDTYDRNSATDFDGLSNTRRDIATLGATWDLDRHQLVYIGGYQRQRLHNRNDLDYGNALPGHAILQDVASNVPGWTHELRFSSVDADFYNYMYGFYYSSGYNSTSVRQQQLARAVAPRPQFLNIATPLQQVSEGFAVFSNQGFQLTDATELQVGLRYQKQRSSIDSRLTASAGGTVYTDLAQHFHAVDEALTGSASLAHQLTDDVRLYANYGRSFRASGRLPVPSNPPLEAGTWDPEMSDSLEVGFKSRLNDGRLQLNGDVFYLKFHDFISRASYIWTNNSRAGSLNNTYGFNYSANVIVRGAELSLDALLTDQWRLGTALSYTDAKFDDAAKPCNVFTPAGNPLAPTVANAAAGGLELGPTGEYFACRSSGRLGSEPNWMASVSSEYLWPLGAYEPFVRGLFNLRSGRAFDVVRNGDTAGYGVFNLYAGVRSADIGWEVSLWAKNVFDRRATTSITDPIQQAQILGDPIATGYHSVQLIPAREVGVTGTYNF